MSATATLAGGCFWCTEAVYQSLSGVEAVESGYIGGTRANPTYEEVCTGTTGHAEAIRITYDPAVIGYGDLLDIFTQYRSAIFPHDAAQETEARAAITRAQADWPSAIVTTIEPLATWYPAEDYHQKYWDRVGDRNPYCMAVIPPKLQKLRKGFAERLRAGN